MTQEEKELYNAANAYAFDLDCGDLNTNRDTFVAGAEWQKKQLIDKTCEAFCKINCYGDPPRSTCISLGTCMRYDDFRKAMEE